MSSFQSYIICTSPRSGSTLLCSLLAATGCCGAPGSHFHKPSLTDWLADYSLARSDYDNEEEALAAVFDAAKKRGQAGTEIFGLRLQRDSFAYFIQQLGVVYGPQAVHRDRLRAAFGRILFIHLTRQDTLDQAISYLRAQQSGLWHRAPDGSELERLAPPAPAVYDAAAIASRMAVLRGANAAWERWFEREGITPLRLSYENLAADPQGALAAILVQLGLDVGAAAGVQAGVARLADTTSREWKARFVADKG